MHLKGPSTGVDFYRSFSYRLSKLHHPLLNYASNGHKPFKLMLDWISRLQVFPWACRWWQAWKDGCEVAWLLLWACNKVWFWGRLSQKYYEFRCPSFIHEPFLVPAFHTLIPLIVKLDLSILFARWEGYLQRMS